MKHSIHLTVSAGRDSGCPLTGSPAQGLAPLPLRCHPGDVGFEIRPGKDRLPSSRRWQLAAGRGRLGLWPHRPLQHDSSLVKACHPSAVRQDGRPSLLQSVGGNATLSPLRRESAVQLHSRGGGSIGGRPPGGAILELPPIPWGHMELIVLFPVL